ncbi:MAC/perforin domain-containing protein [Parabacteroides segnis]|uniref:MAC/perforin domain-containing protein n=1 Tax=Parabacteroides segnis TaxID=2763058 RepID=UPI0035122C64
MKKMSIVLFMFSTLFVSCNKNEIILDDFDPNSTYTVSGSSETKSAGDGVYDLLGYGYDCTISNFRGSLYSKSQVIDLNKFKSGKGKDVVSGSEKVFNPGSIEEAVIHGGGDSQEIWGFNLNEYTDSKTATTNLTKEIGSEKLKLFTVELKNSFSESHRFSSAYSFYSIYAKKVTRKLTLSNVYPNNLKYFLTDNFIADLKNLTGIQLVHKYGTHVLTDILLGGEASITFNAKLISKTQETSFKNEAKKFYNEIKDSSSSSTEGMNKLFQENKDVSIYIKTIGGSSAIESNTVSYNPQTGALGNISFNYTPWLNSVNRNTEQIIGIGNNTTKICLLSEFIDDPNKKREVENAIKSYCESQKVVMTTEKTLDYEDGAIYYTESGVNKYIKVTQGFSLPIVLAIFGATGEEITDKATVKWSFLPIGNYYYLSVKLRGNQCFLNEPKGLFKAKPDPINDFLWDIEKLNNGYYMIKKVSTGTYLGRNQTLNIKNINDTNQHWLIKLY